MTAPAPIRHTVPAVAEADELMRAWHPGAPVGKGRPRCTCKTGTPQIYTPRETVQAERAVGETLRRRWPHETYKAPVVVELLFSLAKPRGGPADLDNLAKLVMDAANGIVWVDDRQVVGLYTRRVVAPVPASVGTLIVIGRDA